MALINNVFKQFWEEDNELLRKILGEQLENRFKSLIEDIPTIKNVEWLYEQEERIPHLIYFKLEKNNGYIFEYTLYDKKNQDLSPQEFNEYEINLIDSFINYLSYHSQVGDLLWTREKLILENFPAPEKTSSTKLKM